MRRVGLPPPSNGRKRKQREDSVRSQENKRQDNYGDRAGVGLVRSRNWCFTRYESVDDGDQGEQGCRGFQYRVCNDANMARIGARYIVCGIEVCPDTGRYHVQGYVQFAAQKSMERVKALLGDDSIHLEPQRAELAVDAANYCKEDGDFKEVGELVEGQGARTDLKKMVEDLKVTANFREAMVNNATHYVRYGGNMERLHKLFHNPLSRGNINVFFFEGLPGVGKSTGCFWLAEQLSYYYGVSWYHARDNENGWMCDYAGHGGVIFNEFGGKMPIAQMLTMLDRWPTYVPVKGSSAAFSARWFIFTSNAPLSDFYLHDPQHAAWLRRVTPGERTFKCEPWMWNEDKPDAFPYRELDLMLAGEELKDMKRAASPPPQVVRRRASVVVPDTPEKKQKEKKVMHSGTDCFRSSHDWRQMYPGTAEECEKQFMKEKADIKIKVCRRHVKLNPGVISIDCCSDDEDPEIAASYHFNDVEEDDIETEDEIEEYDEPVRKKSRFIDDEAEC